MSTASAPTPTKVHLEIPGFAALSERGHWDACSVVAEIDALHACPWNSVALAGASIDAWRWQYVRYGHWTYDPKSGRPIGTTLAAILWHLTQTAIHAHVAGYIPYSDTPDNAALHDFVKRHALALNPIIVQVSNAQALPRAEQGVIQHFITLGGIDSDRGYLVANGDTLDALNTTATTVPLQWATWATLSAAKISGAIALQRIVPAPVPTTSPQPLVTQAVRDSVHELVTQAQALAALLGVK